MRSCVVEVLAFQPDFGPSVVLSEALCVVEGRRASDVVFQDGLELGLDEEKEGGRGEREREKD